VVEDGPADRAGLRKGDIIRDLGGRPVAKFDELIELLKDHAAGARVPITVERQNFRQWERLTLDVQLGKWNLPEYTDDALEAIHRAKALQSSPHEEPLDPRDEPAPTTVFPPDER
jgi:membrane-associated protease RseP (regulator of RpoE activity)